MKKISLVFLVLLTLLFSLNVNAATFELSFDDTYGDGILIDPLVGGGEFSFDGTMPNGTYSLGTLTDFSFFFVFENGLMFDASSSFNTFNINPIEIDVILSSDGQGGQQVKFDSFYGGPLTNYWSSLEIREFSTPEIILSFEPSGQTPSGDPVYYAVKDTRLTSGDPDYNIYKGSYGPSSAVPVPAALWLFGSGLAGLALLRRRRS